jgi:hypothetical protein
MKHLQYQAVITVAFLFTTSQWVESQNVNGFMGGQPQAQKHLLAGLGLQLPTDVINGILPSYSVLRDVLDNLYGPQVIVPGEIVRFSYQWDMDAPSIANPDLVMPIATVKSSFFTCLGGDPESHIKLKSVTTGDEVFLQKPRNGPVGPMVRLYNPESIVGMPQAIVQNRLAPPSTVETLASGAQRWIYHKEIAQTKSEVQKIETQSSGTVIVGTDIVPFMGTTVQKVDVEFYRRAIIWSFAITFGPDNRVSTFERGDVGFTEWTREPQ